MWNDIFFYGGWILFLALGAFLAFGNFPKKKEKHNEN